MLQFVVGAIVEKGETAVLHFYALQFGQSDEFDGIEVLEGITADSDGFQLAPLREIDRSHHVERAAVANQVLLFSDRERSRVGIGMQSAVHVGRSVEQRFGELWIH